MIHCLNILLDLLHKSCPLLAFLSEISPVRRRLNIQVVIWCLIIALFYLCSRHFLYCCRSALNDIDCPSHLLGPSSGSVVSFMYHFSPFSLTCASSLYLNMGQFMPLSSSFGICEILIGEVKVASSELVSIRIFLLVCIVSSYISLLYSRPRYISMCQ